MQRFYSFVLEIPYLFLKKIPYAWVFVVALWAIHPILSGIFLAIILLGLWLMVVQQRAWEAEIARKYQVLYRDQPRAPFAYQLRNAILVCAGSAAFGWFAGGQFGLSALQVTLLCIGVMFLYKDALLFGAGTVYLVTNKGIAIRYVPGHIDYRLFFGYDEIRSVEKIAPVENIPLSWDVLTPRRKMSSAGLLLKPKNINGFSKTIREVVLCPKDMDEFIKHLPSSLSHTI